MKHNRKEREVLKSYMDIFSLNLFQMVEFIEPKLFVTDAKLKLISITLLQVWSIT